MGKFGDNWATAHKIWRGIFAAIGLSIVLIWSLALKKQDDTRIFLRTDTKIATVYDVKITKTDARFGDKNITYFVHLTLSEGKKFVSYYFNLLREWVLNYLFLSIFMMTVKTITITIK